MARRRLYMLGPVYSSLPHGSPPFERAVHQHPTAGERRAAQTGGRVAGPGVWRFDGETGRFVVRARGIAPRDGGHRRPGSGPDDPEAGGLRPVSAGGDPARPAAGATVAPRGGPKTSARFHERGFILKMQYLLRIFFVVLPRYRAIRGMYASAFIPTMHFGAFWDSPLV